LPEGRGGISIPVIGHYHPQPLLLGGGESPSLSREGLGERLFLFFRYHPQPLLPGGGELLPQESHKKTEKSLEFLKEFVKKCGKSSKKRP
jgi:hypothetical protein